MKRVFVTGSTGLLGNNLVRALVARGVHVRALARSKAKAAEQFSDLSGVEVIIGDLENIDGFALSMVGCDTLFHTAAYFRDSYKGGNHWVELERVNVQGTRALLNAAYDAGIRRMVHTSSVAVLEPARPGAAVDETHRRPLERADHYYRSKILSERIVDEFLATHADFNATFVLPGWMWGPGDLGPTSSGQLTLDIIRQKLPGLPPGAFSVVDARDVAAAHISAAERGRRGERYLATGHSTRMRELIPTVGRIAGVPAPKRAVPLFLLYVLAFIQELYARVTGKPVLLSLATVSLMASEGDHSANFDHSKSSRELGYNIRPLEDTIADTVESYRQHGWLTSKASVPMAQIAQT